MIKQNDTRSVVEAYFTAWTNKEVDAAFALLADDLEFRGPSAHYRSAAEFRPGLIGFATMTKAAKVTDLVIDGDRAAMTYDCELPAPVGHLRIASFFRVENGKIRTYETMFDATDFRTLLAGKHAGT